MQLKMYRRRILTLGLAGAALLTAGLAQAQNQPVSGPAVTVAPDLRTQTQAEVSRAMDRTQAGVAKLHLTAEQRAQLKSLAHQDAAKVRAIWDDKSLSNAARRQKFVALHAEARALLTPEQRRQEAALRNQAMVGLFQSVQWVAGQLKLDGDQEDQIRSIVLDSVHQGMQLRTSDADGKPNFAAARQLIRGTQTKIDVILTPEQRAKWRVIQAAARETVLQKVRSIHQSGALADLAPLLQN